MSIINDALKKVQNTITNKQPDGTKAPDQTAPPAQPKPAAPAAPPAPQPQAIIKDQPLSANKPAASPAPEVKRRPSHTPAPLYVIMSLCLLFIAFLWTKWTPLEEPRMGSTTSSANTKGLQVQGIMTMENRKVVLINQDIYQIGDSVKGMTVMDISLDEVKLMADGEIITLEVKP